MNGLNNGKKIYFFNARMYHESPLASLSLMHFLSIFLFVSLPGYCSGAEDFDQMTLQKILAMAKPHPDPLSSMSSHDTFFESMGRVRHVADQVRMHTIQLILGGLRSIVLVLLTWIGCI
jgi:hypothetical protein